MSGGCHGHPSWSSPAPAQPGVSLGPLQAAAWDGGCQVWVPALLGPATRLQLGPCGRGRAALGISATPVPKSSVPCCSLQREHSELAGLAVTKTFCVPWPRCLSLHSRGIRHDRDVAGPLPKVPRVLCGTRVLRGVPFVPVTSPGVKCARVFRTVCARVCARVCELARWGLCEVPGCVRVSPGDVWRGGCPRRGRCRHPVRLAERGPGFKLRLHSLLPAPWGAWPPCRQQAAFPVLACHI